MAQTDLDLDFGKGYKYRPTVGIFKDGELLIDEKTLFAITYWQDFVKGFRQHSDGWGDRNE